MRHRRTIWGTTGVQRPRAECLWEYGAWVTGKATVRDEQWYGGAGQPGWFRTAEVVPRQAMFARWTTLRSCGSVAWLFRQMMWRRIMLA